MKRNFLIILLISALFFTGCSDWLDVNHDPDALEEVPDASVLLPAVEVGVANNLMGWDFGFGGGYWVQYWTQVYTASQFKSLCEYQPEDFNTAYSSLFSQPMADMETIKKMTADDENRGYYFVAEAMSIFTWQIVTDVWGDMPYFDALKGDIENKIYSPEQDTQQEIYADLMTRIDALLAIDLSNSSIDEEQDMVYAGDLAKWKQFASSLKLKLMLRLSETSEYNNATALSYIESADLLSESAKISGSVWDDSQEGKRHPMREFEAGGANYISTNVIACKSFFDYLYYGNDPRLENLFDGDEAAFFGDFESKEDSDGDGTPDEKEKYATVVFPGDMDLMIMSDWEVNFYVAEVYARAGEGTKAKEYYEKAVTASLTQHGISDLGILENGYAQWKDTTIQAEIEEIAMQKWVANCNYQHIESFLERNRTKYPAVNDIDVQKDRASAWSNFPIGDLTVSVKGRVILGGNLPASPLYPEDYITRNTNSPSQKANVGEKVWWNQKSGK
nr:SusD/RagB family nutrient-binding outer membrane lipoprotein [uncultured Draconibacterium sp.]